MAPRPHYRFLHKVLRTLPVTAREVEGVAKQGAAVLGVQRPDKSLVSHPPRAGGGSRVWHTLNNVGPGDVVQLARKLLTGGRLARYLRSRLARRQVLAHAHSALLSAGRPVADRRRLRNVLD